MARRGRRLLSGILGLGLLLLIGLAVPLWSNAGGEKDAVEWLEEYYGESFSESEGEESEGEKPEGEKPPERAPESSLEAKLEIDHAPRIGEVAHITFSVSSHWDFPGVEIELVLCGEQNVDKEAGIECVSWPEEFEVVGGAGAYWYSIRCPLKKEETRIFEFDIRVSDEGVKRVLGHVRESVPIYRAAFAYDNLYVDVGKDETKVSRTPFPPPPEYWATPLIQGTGPMMDLELMREGMEAFIKEAPGLTRWEARWLMDKVEHSVVVEGIPYEEAVRKALRKVLREGRRLAHKGRVGKLEAFKLIVEDWKKNRPADRWIDPAGKKLDENGLPREGLNMKGTRADSVRVVGRWMYKKH